MLRPEVHHTFLKNKNTVSLYAVNNSYRLTGNVPFNFSNKRFFVFLYMSNACGCIPTFQEKKPNPQTTNNKKKKTTK